MPRSVVAALASSAVLLLGGCAAVGPDRPAAPAAAEHFVDSTAAPGERIYVREKHSPGVTPASARRAVIFVHGATFPGAPFDLPVPGYSWMDYVAERGDVAYYLDVRGYGSSTRPKALDEPPQANPAPARTADAARDLADVVTFVRQRTGKSKVHLVGYSWGTAIAGAYTAQNNDRVAKLVLLAPVYSVKHAGYVRALQDPKNPGQINPALGAYRTMTADQARARWDTQIPVPDKSAWREPRVFDALIATAMATDPKSGTHTPPRLRAPNGVLLDAWEIFNERPVYDAGKILVPTLVLRGAEDVESLDTDARGLFARLASPIRRHITIANASHFIGFEKNAWQVHREVQAFLEQ